MSIICREAEISILEQLYNSNRAEFLAIYGRRRIGKTFLIREFFKQKSDAVFFNSTGMQNGTMTEQIASFTEEVGSAFYYSGASLAVGKNWRESFKILTDSIKGVELQKKVVLFFDEFPWMATKNSRLLQNLDYFWNQYWSQDHRIKLIICGSSASWIMDKIIYNKGGLHNRLTKEIALKAFTLCETKKFLHSTGFSLQNRQVLQIYLTTGGIPYYLIEFNNKLSVVQNVKQLAFRKQGLLVNEFDKLYASLFTDHETYIAMIRAIAAHKYGIGQSELFDKISAKLKGKSGLSKLQSLIDSGFIVNFKPMGHSKKGIYYKLIDEYTLFYLVWIEPIKESLLLRSIKRGYWEQQQSTARWYSWLGYAFEAICYKHIAQISDALQLSATAIPYTWRYTPSKAASSQGAQIDLLFERDDDAITICEIKYTEKPFLIDKEYASELVRKVVVFKKITKTKKQIFIAMISANGVKKNKYADELISAVVTLDDLFHNIL